MVILNNNDVYLSKQKTIGENGINVKRRRITPYSIETTIDLLSNKNNVDVCESHTHSIIDLKLTIDEEIINKTTHLNPGEQFGYYLLKSKENNDCTTQLWVYYYNDFLKWKYILDSKKIHTIKTDVCKKLASFCKSTEFIQDRINTLRNQIKKKFSLYIPKEIAEYIFSFVSRKPEYMYASNRVLHIFDDSRYNCYSNAEEQKMLRDEIIEACW